MLSVAEFLSAIWRGPESSQRKKEFKGPYAAVAARNKINSRAPL